MKIYVFGNEDHPKDNAAVNVAEELKKLSDKSTKLIEFIRVNQNEDLPFTGTNKVILMDVISGIDKVTIVQNDKISKLIIPPSTSVHDFDLGFQLKYLKKLNKLGDVTIIGLPQHSKVNYKRLQSILRKLVAQDIQGS